MLQRIYLYTIFFLTLMFWAAFFVFIFYINPTRADLLTLSIFFICLLFALFGSAILVFFYLRLRFLRKKSVSDAFKLAVRQGLLFAVFVIGILLFLALGVFSLWTVGLFLIILILVELILRSK